MRIVAISGLVCALVACRDAEPGKGIAAETEAQLSAVKAATIPEGIQLRGGSGPIRLGTSVVAEWSFEIKDHWSAYSDRAASSLHVSGYRTIARAESSVSVSKHLPGDLYHVHLERAGVGPPLQIHVRFSATPD